MANNKIVYGDQTLIDLTSDTVTPETLAMGETAHSASGAQIVGTMSPSGGTHITPSNASPVTLTSGDSYTADANGYAISSYNNKTPSNASPVALTSGEIDKMGGNGYAIASYNTKSVPSSDTGTPVSVANGEIDKISGNGYLIRSYNSTTPSSTGIYFVSGMQKMSTSGYAYTGKAKLVKTDLWSNPNIGSASSSTSFAGGDVTLDTGNISNYDYIGVKWTQMYGTTVNDSSNIWPVNYFKAFTPTATSSGVVDGFFGIYASGTNSYWYLRNISYVNDTTVHFSNCWRMRISTSGTNTTSNTRIIPLYVQGYKVQA